MFIHPAVEFDSAAVEKFLKDETARKNLRILADRLKGLPEFTLQTVDTATRRLAEELGIKAGALIGPARVALTGQSASPGIFEVMLLLGRDMTVSRLYSDFPL
jgi:glutamyl-tRNA synthetase